MRRLMILATLILTSSILLTSAQSQQYQWGLPQAVQTPVALGPQAPEFPAIRYPNIPPPPPQKRGLKPVRKVTGPVYEPIAWMPPAPTPIYPVQKNSVYLTTDSKLMLQRSGLSFHTDSLGLQTTSPIGEFGFAIVDPNLFKIRYSITTQQAVEETLPVTQGLMIGAAQLVAAQAAAGQAAPVAGAAAAGTPIKLNWQEGPSHRIDVVCIQTKTGPQNFWLSPAVVANWIPFEIKGSTTTGTIVSATERFNNFYWGGGLEMVYQQPYSRISALVAGSDKYLMADCSLAYSVGSNLDLSFGWQGKQLKMERDTIIRTTAPTLGVLVRF